MKSFKQYNEAYTDAGALKQAEDETHADRRQESSPQRGLRSRRRLRGAAW